MSDTEKDVGELKGAIEAHSKRLDGIDTEVKELRKTKHDHANIIHNHQGILQTIEKSISDLVSATGLSAEATNENTKAISDFRLVVKTALWLIPTASAILISLIPFLKFLNTIYFWW
jgi:predicted  nucleic acid-binding Zn-ribbon protein